MITIICPIAITKINGIAIKTARQLSKVRKRGSIIDATTTNTIIMAKIPNSLIRKNLSKKVI